MPASVNSSLRSRVRQAQEHQSLGLEDELDFGSDEDLMETIGEIEVAEEDQAAVPDLPDLAQSKSNSGSNRRLKSSKTSSRSLRKEGKNSHNSSSSSLASSTHLLPPLPPVPSGAALDLPTDMFGSVGSVDSRKRGSILGAFKGMRRRKDDQSSKASFMTDSQSMGSTISLSKITSNTSSRPSFATSIAPSSISAAPHLGPLPSFDTVSVSEQKMAMQKQQPMLPQSQHAPPVQHQLYRAEVVPDTAEGRTSWSASEISSAILPSFPATLASLEPITVLVAQAAKRPAPSIMAGRSHGQSKTGRWAPCTLVFTLFKVSTGEGQADDERTVAHVHVFTQKQLGTSGMNSVRRSKSTAGFGMEQVPRVETERRNLTRQSSASVSDEHTDVDGRMVVLRVSFGTEDRSKGNEWVLEMKDTSRLHEWVRQIKKTAIMVNAEELGYGHAIRPAFESSSVSADDLAQRLSAHARSVAEQREKVAAVTPPPRKESAVSPAASQQDVRSASAEAAQAAALSRSRSADQLGTQPLVSPKIVTPAPDGSEVERVNGHDDSDITGLSLGTLNLGSSLSFPTPPSALPPPRVRTSSANAPQQPVPVNNASQASLSPAPTPRAVVRTPEAAATPVLYSDAQQTVPNGLSHSLANGSSQSLNRISPPMNGRASFSPTLQGTPTFSEPIQSANGAEMPETEELEEETTPVIRPPTPPRRSTNDEARASQAMFSRNHAPSIASTTHSGTSSTSRLRKLRGKPQVIDIMAEFNSIEAENTPPAEDEEPIRDDRERRIRFAEG